MRKFAIFSVLMMLFLALPATAQDEEGLPDFIEHTECAVDLTGLEIPIVHLGDISSAGYSPITLPLVAGFEDAINYYNARGGACGATFSQENFDTGGDPNRTSEGYAQLTADPIDMLVLYSSADSELLRPTVVEDEIPVVISAGSIPGLYGENSDDPGWIYATNPLYADQFAMFCDYVASAPDVFGEEPVLGYLGWGAPFASFGLAAFTDGAVDHCESVGVEVIDEPQTFSALATATDVAVQVEALINEGATILYTNALASGPVRVAEAVELIGFSDELQMAAVNWGMDTSAALLSASVLRASDGLPVMDGVYGSMPFAWYSDVDNPGIQLVTQQAVENERGIQSINISYILGWTLVDQYVEMYAIAANRIAEEQGITDGAEVFAAIDGPLMRDVLENLDYAPLGILPIDFQSGAIRSVAGNRIVQMQFESAEITGPPLLVPLFPEEGFADTPDTVGVRMEMMEEEE